MKTLALIGGAMVLLAGLAKPAGQPTETTLVVGGDFLGSLSPCGCTKPMVGGVRRWATAVRTLQRQGDTVVAINGGLVQGTGRQDELKAESLAEMFRELKVPALNLTVSEAKLGRGLVSSIDRLSGDSLVSTSLEPSLEVESKSTVESGPFLFGGLETDSKRMASMLSVIDMDLDKAAQNLVQEAGDKGLAPVALLSGNESQARELAKKHPQLAAIVFRSSSPNIGPMLKEGSTVLVTPGEKNRELVTLVWDGNKFSRSQVVTLGPEISDDTEVGGMYSHYLERVDSENLLDAVPRTETPAYAGTAECMSCHLEAADAWKASLHSHALKTLEDESHGRDPDCVGCHVVGLGSSQGFMSRAKTPELANVGCENCHGPGKDHAMSPAQNRMTAKAADACIKCHDKDHSPKFDFSTFWPKIRH